MRSVTPNRVLPHWAIVELGQACDAYDLKVTVRPLSGNCPQMEVKYVDDYGDFRFIVSMRDDWEDLRTLVEGDLWDIVSERYMGFMNE